MSIQPEFKVEDFNGVRIEESWSQFDVLVALCKEVKKLATKRKQSALFPIHNKKQDHLSKKRRRLDETDLPRVLNNTQETKMIMKIKISKVVQQGPADLPEPFYEKDKPSKKRRLAQPSPPKVVQQRPAAGLPKAFYQKVTELCKGKNLTERPFLVIQKKLYRTDVTSCQNRLSLPKNQIFCDFLTKEEDTFISGRDEYNHMNSIEVTIIEPLLGIGNIKLTKWNYKKPSGDEKKTKKKKNVSYVLIGSWMDIVSRNDLSDGMTVQVWAFRIDEELCFALVNLGYLEEEV